MMGYKITIERTHEEVQVCGKDWDVIGQEEYKSEYADGDIRLKNVNGYTPEIEKTVTVTQKVYEQVVDELDIGAVIATINDPVVSPQDLHAIMTAPTYQ